MKTKRSSPTTTPTTATTNNDETSSITSTSSSNSSRRSKISRSIHGVKKKGGRLIRKITGRQTKATRTTTDGNINTLLNPPLPSVPELMHDSDEYNNNNGGISGMSSGSPLTTTTPSNNNNSNNTSGSSNNNSSFIHVVLLLMNPKSRRFEILMLDFDGNRALVSDVLDQISKSATEESFRNTNIPFFSGVTNRNGDSMNSNDFLRMYCGRNGGSDVLMAVPRNMTEKECVDLSKPILDDPNVLQMLEAHGIQAHNKNPKQESKNTSKQQQKQRSINNQQQNTLFTSNSTHTTKSNKWSFIIIILLFMMISLLCGFLFIWHQIIIQPLFPGDILHPGQFRSTCGIFTFIPKIITTTNINITTALPFSFCDYNKEIWIHMNQMGILTVQRGGSSNTTKQYNGNICIPKEQQQQEKEKTNNDDDDSTCVNGALVESNGYLMIGTKLLDINNHDNDNDNDCWPICLNESKRTNQTKIMELWMELLWDQIHNVVIMNNNNNNNTTDL